MGGLVGHTHTHMARAHAQTTLPSIYIGLGKIMTVSPLCWLLETRRAGCCPSYTLTCAIPMPRISMCYTKGKWYATIATDGCNSSRYRPSTSPPAPPPSLIPCSAGGQLDLWTSDALRGPTANWRHVDAHPLFTSNRTALTGHGTTAIEGRELVRRSPRFCSHLPQQSSARARARTPTAAPVDSS